MGRRGGNNWLIRVGNRLRAVLDMPPIQRGGRPVEGITMSAMSSTQEGRGEGGSMFGRDVGEAVDSDGVNRFVKWCVSAILETGEGLATDALYRASGGQGEIRRIQDQSESGMQEVLRQEMNVHVLTGALKWFFRTLQQPILRVEDFQNVLEGDNQQLSQVIASLPHAERCTLSFLFQHLQEVVQHPHNHMDEHALSVVFGPTLMHMRSSDVSVMAAEIAAQGRLFELLLDHCDNVFATSPDALKCRETPVRESRAMIHEDELQPQDFRPRATNHEHSSSLDDEETNSQEIITVANGAEKTKDSARQSTNGEDSPTGLSDDDDCDLQATPTQTSAPRRDVAQLSTTANDSVARRRSARQSTNGEDSPTGLSDDDDCDLEATPNQTSVPRRDVARLSTIATSVRLNAPTAL